MNEDLTELEAQGMTVNERLYLSGLIDSFEEAEIRRDESTMRLILEKVHLPLNSIEEIIAATRNRR